MRFPRIATATKKAFFLATVTLLLAISACVTVSPPTNSAPVAQDQNVTVNRNTAKSITLVATDADTGDTLTYTIVSLPTSGTLLDPNGSTITSNGTTISQFGTVVTYTPPTDFTGTDTFTFAASDGTNTSNTATVILSVETETPDIATDQTYTSLNIASGETTTVGNDAVLTVTGDTTIDGTVYTTDGRLTLKTSGDVTINGTIRSVDTSTTGFESDTAFNQQRSGIHIIVGSGTVTFGANSGLETTGNIIITDDETILTKTPQDYFDEVETIGTDGLPTLVPLPPDNHAFDTLTKIVPLPKAAQGATGPITISGTWPPAGAASPPGDKPVWIFRFNQSRDLNLNGWTVNAPAAPVGTASDTTADAGEEAQGKNGKNGMRLNIWNNSGAINIVNNVILNLPAGGDGGTATADCADATGGNGGSSGNFRMTASGGIDLSSGTLTLNAGKGGDGGKATVVEGAAAASGCPGEDGDTATATGGIGADNKKRLYAKGNVAGIENVTIGPIIAGNGGEAVAAACDGGDGDPCCDGGKGGNATATGGKGGDASLDVGTLAVTTGAVTGGNGGNAITTGADGGDGGDCKLADAGNGGDGGTAVATGGNGGSATGGTSTGGNGGNASATGGNGGDGGDSGWGTVGTGGSAGTATATAGSAGTGTTAGSAGTTTKTNGTAGADGEVVDVLIFCIPLDFFQDAEGGEVLVPGTYEGNVTNEEGTAEVGTIDVIIPATSSGTYAMSNSPVDHIGIGGGYFDVDVSSLNLTSTESGPISGLQIGALSATGIDSITPLTVEALDSDGNILDTVELSELHDNTSDPENPQLTNALFDSGLDIASIRVKAP